MLDTLISTVLESQSKWTAQIEESKDGCAVVDISKEVIKIFQKFLMLILLGEDIDSDQVEIQARADGGKYESK